MLEFVLLRSQVSPFSLETHKLPDTIHASPGVIVAFDFTNNSSEAVTLNSASLSLIDSSGNKSEADPDTFGYIPANKDIFLENVNPGVTRPGEVTFTGAPDASGFKLQMGDTNPFTDKSSYVDLGF